MVYNTQYYLTAFDAVTGKEVSDEKKNKFEAEITKLSGWKSGSIFAKPTAWFEYEEIMRKFSKRHPGTRFTLRGDGDDHDDIWVRHFLNGKMQVCPAKIIFEDFNVDQLA